MNKGHTQMFGNIPIMESLKEVNDVKSQMKKGSDQMCKENLKDMMESKVK